MSVAPQSPHTPLWKRAPMPRVVLLTAGTVVVLAGATYAVVRSSKPPTPTHYLTSSVKYGNLALTDSSTGEIVAAQQDTVTIPSNGVISHINVSLAQQVSAGQILATLSDPSLISTLTQDESTVLSDQNKVNLLSSTSYQTSQRLAIIQAQDNLSQAQSTLATDQATGHITSPSNGSVSLVATSGATVSKGQTVATVNGHTVTAPFTGTVNPLVSSGAVVNQGQTIYTETSPSLQSTILSDQSNIAGLQSSLAKLEATNNPTAQGLALSQAKAQLAQDVQALNAVKAQVQQLTIKAPYSGQITMVNPSATGGHRLLTLYSDSKTVTIAIPAIQISQVHVGQTVTATLPAFASKAYHGTISSISPVGTYSSGVSTFQATATLQVPSSVRYGMGANVNITVAHVSHQLLVPIAALHTKGSRYFVMILNHGHRQRVPVKVVLQGSSKVAVTSHRLKAGSSVITATLSSTSTKKLKLHTHGRPLHGHGKAHHAHKGGKP